MPKLLKNIMELMGVVFLRFAALPRIWCIWLVGLHAAGLAFIGHVEAQAVLGATTIAVLIQALIYDRIGFTRILGVSHLVWVPLFAWLASRGAAISAEPALMAWLVTLAITNATCLAVDLVDAWRYVRGERAPHYQWARG